MGVGGAPGYLKALSTLHAFCSRLHFLEERSLKIRTNIKMIPVRQINDFMSSVVKDQVRLAASLPQLRVCICNNKSRQVLSQRREAETGGDQVLKVSALAPEAPSRGLDPGP